MIRILSNPAPDKYPDPDKYPAPHKYPAPEQHPVPDLDLDPGRYEEEVGSIEDCISRQDLSVTPLRAPSH